MGFFLLLFKIRVFSVTHPSRGQSRAALLFLPHRSDLFEGVIVNNPGHLKVHQELIPLFLLQGRMFRIHGSVPCSG